MAKLGVGIVGCGRNGGNHARVWSTIEEASIIGVYDVDDTAARERAGELGVRAFASLEGMVAEPAVEAVDVVTSGSHRDTAVVAAGAGKHVMVENPFAVTVQEADDMIAAAEGRPPSCDGRDGLMSTAAAVAVRESHETGLPVRISA